MKQLNQQVDKWFLEFKTRSTRSKKRTLGRSATRRPLKLGTGLKNIQSAALKKPEVMVKIPPRKGKTSGLGAVRNHLDYISRNGKLAIEDQDGLFIQERSRSMRVLPVPGRRWVYLKKAGKEKPLIWFFQCRQAQMPLR